MTIKQMVLSGESSLPPKVLAAFLKLGDDQRGRPESAMLKAAEAMGGGVCQVLIEHVGDLTHRMTHMLKWGDDGHGYGMVKDKVSKTLRWLTNSYGFEKEFNQNLTSNAAYRKVPLDEMRRRVDAALLQYANEHRRLDVYNRTQWLARQAAISCGEQKWDNAVICLRMLEKCLSSEGLWARLALEYEADKQGNPIEYKHNGTTARYSR